MKCTECGNAMVKSVGDHVYRESGMDNVILRNITKYTCPTCGAKRIQLFAMGPLHDAIALAIAQKPARLVPSEVRFLRDYLEMTNTQFATIMGVTPAQASRWTSSDPIGVPAERFLRALVAAGRDLLRGEADAQVDKMLQDTTRLRAMASAMARVFGSLPPPSAEAEEVEISLRRSKGDIWTSVSAAN